MTTQNATKKTFINPSWENDLKEATGTHTKEALQVLQNFMKTGTDPEYGVKDQLISDLFDTDDDVFFGIYSYKILLLAILENFAAGSINGLPGTQKENALLLRRLIDFFDSLLIEDEHQAEIEYSIVKDYGWRNESYCNMVIQKYNDKMCVHQ